MELNFLEIFGTIVGLVYLWLEYRASIYLWIAGIVMPAIYIFVYYKAGLYADFGINIYYLIAAIYGWFFWMWGHRKEKSQQSADASTGDKPQRSSYRAYSMEMLLTSFSGIYCCIYRHCMDTDRIYGQQRALAG